MQGLQAGVGDTFKPSTHIPFAGTELAGLSIALLQCVAISQWFVVLVVCAASWTAFG